MLGNSTEYVRAKAELQSLETWLSELLAEHPLGVKGYTKASVRKMIARLHEELALFEGSRQAR